MSDLISWLHEFADACEIVAAGRWPGPRTAARLREVADALAAAKQQGQAVACVCCEDKPAPGNNPCGWCGRTAPPSAPVGVEWPLSLLRAEHWREVYIGHRCMRLEVTYDCATWERLMAEVESALAQQPAARPPKPTECMNGCPDRQVCNHCQWPPGPDQHPAAVDGDFINRIADSLIAKGWDIDPNCDGTGVAQLREAVISVLAAQPGGSNNDR